MLSCGVAANGICLSVQRTPGGQCGLEAVPKDGVGIYIQSVEYIIDRCLCTTLAGNYGVQEVLYQVELEDSVHRDYVVERIVLVVANTID